MPHICRNSDRSNDEELAKLKRACNGYKVSDAQKVEEIRQLKEKSNNQSEELTRLGQAGRDQSNLIRRLEQTNKDREGEVTNLKQA